MTIFEIAIIIALAIYAYTMLIVIPGKSLPHINRKKKKKKVKEREDALKGIK